MFIYQCFVDNADFIRFNRYYLESKEGKRLIRKCRILIFVIIFVTSLINDTRMNYIANILAFSIKGIVFLICCLFLKLFLRMIMERNSSTILIRAQNTGEFPYHVESILIFSDEGICERTEISERKIKYAYIQSIVSIDQDIFIYLEARQGFILPIRAFKSREEVEKFLKYMETKAISVIYAK